MKFLSLVQRAEYLAEAKALCLLAGPIIVTFLLSIGINVAVQILVGHLSASYLASAALASMFANAFGLSIVLGCASSCDTLCSQAFGAQNYGRVGVVALRGCVVGVGLCAVVGLGWWFLAGPFFTLMGQDPEISSLSSSYLRVLLLGLPAQALFETLKKPLNSIGQPYQSLVLSVVCLCSSIFFGSLFVYEAGMGIYGAPLASAISHWLSFLLLVVYLRNHRAVHAIIEYWVPQLKGSSSGAPPREVVVVEKGKEKEKEEGGGDAQGLVAKAGGGGGGGGNGPTPHQEVDTSAIDLTPTLPPPSPLVDSVVVSAAAAAAAAAVKSPKDFKPWLAPGEEEEGEEGGVSVKAGGGDKGGEGACTSAPPPISHPPLHDLLDAVFPSDIKWGEVFLAKGITEYLLLGAPSSLMLFVEWGSYEALSLIAGMLSPTDLAANAVLATTATLSFMPFLGFSVACCIRVGSFLGELKHGEAKRSYHVSLLISLGLILLNFVVIASARNVWALVFTQDEAVRERVAALLFILTAYTLFDGIQCVSVGALRGVSLPGPAAFANIFAYLMVGLPLAYSLALPAGWGLTGIWCGFVVAVLVAAILMSLWLNCFVNWEKKGQEARARGVQGGGGGGGH